LNKNHFLGVIVDNNTITRAFACGIKGADVDTDTLEVIVDPGVNDGTPFCIEGTTDGSKHRQNIDLITGPTLWNNPNLASKSCYANGTYYVWCESSTLAVTIRTGVVFTEPTNTYDDCFVGNDGMLVCEE